MAPDLTAIIAAEKHRDLVAAAERHRLAARAARQCPRGVRRLLSLALRLLRAT